MKRTNTRPRYLEIATDIAGKIVSGEYAEGDRMFARSTLAVQYRVSSETARRAIALLAEVGIISVVKGSGCTVASVEKAERFRNQQQGFDSVHSLQAALEAQVAGQKQSLLAMEATVGKLAQQLSHYQHANPLIPMKMKITAGCRFLGESIGNIHLWQHTRVTVVAIERNNVMEVSPGPYAQLNIGDQLYFVGPDESWLSLKKFLYEEQ